MCPSEFRRNSGARRVALSLDASAILSARYGADHPEQILWMLLDGLTVNQIAAALHCPDKVITCCIAAWKGQVAERAERGREDYAFVPRATNPRRPRAKAY